MAACMLFAACSDDPVEKKGYNPGGNSGNGNNNTTDTVQQDKKPYRVSLPTGGQLKKLRADGRWLVDESGNHVNVHGFWQTHSPFFNGNKWGNDYNYNNCLAFNLQQIDDILCTGYKMDYMRLHMDTYWMTDRDRPYPLTRPIHEYYNEDLFQEALEKLYVPIIKHCISRGLHVQIHPGFVGPGANDEQYNALENGDDFHKVLMDVWDRISSHPYICNNADVWFELLNEPVHIVGLDGSKGSSSDSQEKALTKYMQTLIDVIRGNDAGNLIWVTGTSWQQHYSGFVKYPIEDYNYGFAIHCYPGWYGSDAEEATSEYGKGDMGGGYESFRKGWDDQITPVSKIAPVMITEMDWAPKEYGLSWGKSFTGEGGGAGFGANFKYLADRTGNCSYIFFTAPEHLAIYDWNQAPVENANPKNGDEYHFLYDPKACNNQIFAWYEAYSDGRLAPKPEEVKEIKIGGIVGDSFNLTQKRTAIVNAITNKLCVFPLQDGFTVASSNESVVSVKDNVLYPIAKSGSCKVTITALNRTREYDVTVKGFELDWTKLDPKVYKGGEDKTQENWNASTRILVTGQWGFGGWKFSSPLDLSQCSKIVCVLGGDTESGSGASFRIFDNGYWDGAVEKSIPNETNANGDYEIVIDLKEGMTKSNGKTFDLSSVGIIGIWSNGGKKIHIKDIYWE